MFFGGRAKGRTTGRGGLRAAYDAEGRIIRRVYMLYLVGFVFPLTVPIGFAIAYSQRDHALPGHQEHFSRQIGIFWSGFLVLTVLGAILVTASGFYTVDALQGTHEGTGFVLFIAAAALGVAWFAWTLYRVLDGLRQLIVEQALLYGSNGPDP